MKLLAIILISLSFYSCTKSSSPKDQTTTESTGSTVNKELKVDSDHFEVGDKKKAGCDNEIDLKKKLEQEIQKSKIQKKPKAIKLQGSDTGCATD